MIRLGLGRSQSCTKRKLFRNCIPLTRKEFLCLKTEDPTRRQIERILTVPNMITISRIIASPALGYAIYHDYHKVALAGCMIAGLSDWLDGYIAKNYNQATVLGAFLDPVADKVMIGVLSISLALKGLLPFELVELFVGRDILLVACSFALRAYERPIGSPFFDTTSSATFQITPSEVSKVNTAAQFLLLSLSLLNFATNIPTIHMIEPLWYVTAVTTVGSGLAYLDGTGFKRLGKTGVGRGQ